MPEIFLKRVEKWLSERLDETTANQIISRHQVIQDNMDRQAAHQFIMALVPDIIAQAGMMEGLAISQEVKDIYNREFS
jgi:hypothetical protein